MRRGLTNYPGEVREASEGCQSASSSRFFSSLRNPSGTVPFFSSGCLFHFPSEILWIPYSSPFSSSLLVPCQFNSPSSLDTRAGLESQTALAGTIYFHRSSTYYIISETENRNGVILRWRMRFVVERAVAPRIEEDQSMDADGMVVRYMVLYLGGTR